MVSISKCPRCHQFVSLPEGVDLESIVRCPFCAAEYALSASLPPSLIVVKGAEAAVAGAGLPETVAADSSQDGLTLEPSAVPAISEPGDSIASDVAGGDDLGWMAPLPVDETDALSDSPDASVSDETLATAEEMSDEPTTPALGAEESIASEQAEPASEGGGMFDFLNGGGSSPAASAAAAGAAVDPASPAASGIDAPFWGGGDVSSPSNGDAPKSLSTARPRRRKEKSAVKEMVGAIIGGFVGLSIGYYGLNYFGDARFDFLNIWLPGVAHTERHRPWGDAGKAQDDTANDVAETVVYPADPKPDGAIMGGYGRYIDINFQRLVLAGKILPDSSEPLVSVTIDDKDYMTAAEGSVIETLEEIAIGGGGLRKGHKLRRKDQWWVEVVDPKPTPDPAEIAKADPPAESQPGDKPKAKPEPKKKPLPEGYIGPKNRPSYTMAQLGEALKGAHVEMKGLKEHDELTDSLYEKLCQLAERLTFIDVEPDAAGLFDRQLAVETMLESYALRGNRLEEIASRAGARLDDLDTADGGIVLAGKAGRVVARDGLHGTMLTLPGGQAAYNVLSDQPLGAEDGDSILVVGVAVTEPSENLIGYSGSKPVVIWATMAITLPASLDMPEEPMAEETPKTEPPAEETPAKEPLPEEPMADEAPVEEPAAEEAPADEAPAKEPATEETPAMEEPVEEPAAEDTPAMEEPAKEPAAEEEPAMEEPVEEPKAEDAADEEPMADEAPADEAPADEAPADEAPAKEPATVE